jgi:hypothetical protein
MRTIIALFLLTATWYINEQSEDQMQEGQDGWGLLMFLCGAGLFLCLAQDIKSLF